MTDAFWSLITTPWALQPDTLLGAALLALLAALLGEAVWRVLRWPRVLGYTLVGTALALAGRSVGGDEPALRLAVDGALALLLFEAGARLDLRWLTRNPWLLASSVAEAALAGIAVWLVLRSLAVTPAVAAPWRSSPSRSRQRSCSAWWANSTPPARSPNACLRWLR